MRKTIKLIINPSIFIHFGWYRTYFEAHRYRNPYLYLDKNQPQNPCNTLPAAVKQITYSLRAGNCDKTISKRTCNHTKYSLTNWKQANATRPSARRLAAMEQVHLLPEARQTPQAHQQENQQPWNRFTYSLKADKCHKTISKRTCSYEIN